MQATPAEPAGNLPSRVVGGKDGGMGMDVPQRRAIAHRLAWLRLNRCALLLARLILFILILFILLYPFTHSHALDRLAVNGLLHGVLLLAGWALSPHRRVGLPSLVLVAVLALVYAAVLAGVERLAPMVSALYAVLEAMLTVALLSYVLDTGRVTADKILGAVAAFVLLAMLFATLFAMLQLAEPGALRSSIDAGGPMGWFALFYFAVTMLTSTGFGDIVPTNDRARALVIVAQITGTMYIAFLVARLANLCPARRRPGGAPPPG